MKTNVKNVDGKVKSPMEKKHAVTYKCLMSMIQS